MLSNMELFKDPRRTLVKEETLDYKIKTRGIDSLSNVEILSLVIGDGSYEDIEKARAMINESENLHSLKVQSEDYWRRIPGVGTKKARAIVAMSILQKRIQGAPWIKQINCSRDAFDIIYGTLADLDHEQFWILSLNRANKVITKSMISQGGVAGTVVDAKIVFRKALENKATAVILAHNHPSGNLYPSQADIDLTKKLVRAGQSLDIPVLDHLIIGGVSYYSFADERKL